MKAAVLAWAFSVAGLTLVAGPAECAEQSAWNAAVEARVEALRADVDAAASLDELLVALGVAPNDQQARLHARLLRDFGDEPIVRHGVAVFCDLDDSPTGPPCGTYDAVQAYADADPDNAWPWLLLAARAHRNGDADGAWRAIARATEAKRADDYGSAKLRAFDAFVADIRLPDGSQPPVHERHITTLGFWLAVATPIERLRAVCPTRTGAELMPEQQALCFRVGRVLADAPMTVHAWLGVRMLERHARGPDDQRYAVQRSAEQSALYGAAVLLPDLDGHSTPSASDAAAFDAYVQDMLEGGEVAASRRLVERQGYTLDAWTAAHAARTGSP